MDQLAFLTLSGIEYTLNNDGSARTSSAFSNLSFASDFRVPTTNRHFRVDSTANSDLIAGNTANVIAADTLTYKAVVNMGIKAKTNYVKPLMSGGKEFYVCFVRPEAMGQLKKDADYQRAVITGLPRAMNNPFFSGGTVTTDGIVFHEHRLVYNTLGAASGSKWGAGGAIDGSRALLCGSQALGFADLGAAEWAEKMFEYDSSPGINVDKMFGFLKPQFFSIYNKAVEDFGVIAVDHAI